MKFLKELQKRVFPFIVLITALSVSVSAAFYSVTGLSKLFAGARLEVLIMTSSLEFAKIIIASLLHRYWNALNKLLRTYLTIAVVTLIGITSMGIYGFLSSAYQETANKNGIIEKEINILELKKNRFEEDRDNLLNEKNGLDESIGELRQGLSNNVIQYKDSETGEIITTTSSSTRKALEGQLEQAIIDKRNLSIKIETVTDSITKLDLKILDIESSSDVASELGPLKYISELTNTPMNKIVNYLLLVIVFVFDPLAIALIIASNFLFEKLQKAKDKIKNEDVEDETIEEELLEEPIEEIDEDNIEETNDLEEVPDVENQDNEQDEINFEDNKKSIHIVGDDEEDWDEMHAHDMVLNNMFDKFVDEENIFKEDIKEDKDETVGDVVEETVEEKPKVNKRLVYKKRDAEN
jgi:hypothetical protein